MTVVSICLIRKITTLLVVVTTILPVQGGPDHLEEVVLPVHLAVDVHGEGALTDGVQSETLEHVVDVHHPCVVVHLVLEKLHHGLDGPAHNARHLLHLGGSEGGGEHASGPLPVLAPHVDQVRDVVAPVQKGSVYKVLCVLDEHLLEDLGASGGDDRVGAPVPAHDPSSHGANLFPKLLHPGPVCLEIILH